MRKYNVDVHWDFARSYKVEADSRESAERIVEATMSQKNFSPLENGFEQCHDFEVHCSGESGVNGEMHFF